MLKRVSTQLGLMRGWRRWLSAFLAGALLALALAPYHLFVVGFVSFPVLVWLLDGAAPEAEAGRFRRYGPAFGIGWWFGFGYFLAGLWWIANALLVEARDFIWFIPLAVVGLPAILALFYGLATVMARAFWSDGFTRLAMLAFGFGVAEIVRANVATGFPWNALGYTLTPTPMMMQSASVIGVDGLTLIAVFLFALPAMFAASGRQALSALLLIGTILSVHIGYGAWRLAQAEPSQSGDGLVVRIVQPSIDQSTKVAMTDREGQLATMLALTRQPSNDGVLPDIVLWPETAVPYILSHTPQVRQQIADHLEPGQTLLTGAVRIEGDIADRASLRYFNSIQALDDQGAIFDSTDKVHLVPFGEYLPFRELLSTIGLRAVATADRGYVGALERKYLTIHKDFSLLPLICYEVIFSRYARVAALEADAIVTVSNDGWYGDTAGPHQHLHHARLRSVETGLPMIRAANTGISAAYDGYGRTLGGKLPYNAVDFMQFEMEFKLPHTQYLVYGLCYHWLLLIVCAVIGLFGFWRFRAAH